MKGKTDEELIDHIRDHSLPAFNELYDRYWNPLLAKAADRLKNREDAEEVLQELFVNLWRRRERLVLQFTFRTYIYAALKYEILRQVAKSQIRRNEVALEDNSLMEFLSLDESFFSVEIKELQVQIEQEINKLPEKCRLIFRMSRNEGMSAKEIADNLNLSTRTVENQIGKALKILKGSLKSFIFLF
ncbi:RNA polymerase sigma-70 factor [Mucilaginibacter sp. UR6-1]|uniref:RNA polymerase sigma-70 factor n=1 Tax=Mucilaginibacter sp. UR6-1 TaxID=1435643 RepID=UPI001E2FB8B3|nr:RNA polymerase sigma-70 factor [Mucilaginibacter sp. UR6-1]MCC8411265.1 RNA polymerase sigma-70 factor [Mucilaginibacter sp. UR6-1]